MKMKSGRWQLLERKLHTLLSKDLSSVPATHISKGSNILFWILQACALMHVCSPEHPQYKNKNTNIVLK